MKKLIILILISLWAFVDTKAQSNYFIASVADVKIYEGGSGLLSRQELTDTSEVATSQRFWFLSPKGFDPGSQQWYQAGYLNVGLTNLSSTQWKKITLYDFTGTNILYVENIAPNAIISFDFGNNRRLDASKDYYWKFENITSQSVVCNNDIKIIAASSFEYIDVLNNDKNLPSGADCRLKAGQTLTGGISVIKDQFAGLKVTTSSQQGSFSFVYEVVLNGTVLGEATATVTVGNASQYCTVAILSEQLQVGSQTIHEFTLYSPNAQINPFNYTVRTGSFTGTIVKSGTTPPATSNKEIIDFGTLPTGTYYVTFSSTVSECFDLRAVSHIASNDACNTSIISIDKLNGTNNYSVNSSFSNVTSIKAYLINAEISVGVPLLSQINITTPAFNLNLTTLSTGTYYLNIEGEGKFCKAQKVFEHTLVEVTSGAKLETWTKFIHNYKDNWIISGKNDYESGRDKFGLQTFSEKAQNVVWKTFISDFENLGNSTRAKAIVGFRKDTTRNEVGISVAVTPNSIILQQRLTKSGTTNVLATVNNITMPVWVRLTKTGNDLVADFSKDLTMTPVYQELGRVNGVFSGWSNYQKYIGVASAKTDVIATARFQGQLGGNVNFASPTVIINPPVIASNIINPTNGQSVTLLTSTACFAPSTNRWYKNSETTSFSSGASVNVQAYHTDSYYARCENGLNKSIKSNTVLFTIGNLASCNNGTQPFAVVTAVYSGGNVSFSFNAANLSNANWTILNGSTVVKTLTVQPNASTMTVPSGNLPAGNYIFKLDGISCNGSAQKSFTVAGAISAPMVTSLPASPVAGDNITLTATGCVGNYNWYASGASQPYATNAGSSTVSGVAGGTYYYATCIGSNVPSNYVNIGAVTVTGGTGQVTFVNQTKNAPTELTNGKYSPNLFKLTSANAIPLSIDPALNKLYPNWAVAWQAEGGNFSRNNTTTVDVGMSFMYDRRPFSNAGYGERCLDYFWESNFDTGQEWANGIDPVCNKTINTFTSRIPFQERAFALYGVASPNDRTEWINNSTSWIFDKGVEGVSSRGYGWGDRLNGKVNTGLVNCDIEIGLEQGFEYYPKHLSFLLGMGSASQGYVFSQYSAAINEVGANPSFYPNDAGVFPNLRKKLDGTNYLDGNGLTVTNNIPISPDWNPLSKITISDRGITNKGIIDYPNVLPCIEISSTSDMTYRHGETYARKNGWASINGNDPTYSASNPIENTVVDKFGMDRNTNHIIADIICYGDVNKWWGVNKLNGRKVILQSKITCDRSNMGVHWEAGFTNQALRFKHYDREYGFDIGGFTALTGCEWQIWDRNTQENLDGYHGAFGLVNLMNQRKSFGTSSESYTSLKPRLNFLLWNSEISYDGGSNYVKDKAPEYVLSENKLPQRQAISTDGYWVIFAARPEGIEPTTAKLRVTYNGVVYYHTIGVNDWETVDYAHQNTALSNLPLSKKDYYFTIIKLGSQVVESSSVTAPVINSNPSNPTAGTSVTFSTFSCSGTVKWFVGDAQVSTGTSYTVSNPVANNSYFATCTVNNVSSGSSNVITVSAVTPPSSGVTITEPAIIATQPYYFTNGQPRTHYLNTDGSFTGNSPVIYRSNTTNVSNYQSRPVHPTIRMESGYSMTNDLVWLQNNKAKFGINLLRGGQLAWASLIDATTNLVYNGYDGGFQVTLDAYQKKDGYSQNGKFSRQQFDEILQFSGDPNALNAVGRKINMNSYNTTMGGDFVNNSQSLLYHYRDGNSYIVGVRPIFYTINSEFSQVIIETKYTLEPDAISLRIEHKYISKRTDTQFDGGGFDGAAAPACFLVNTLSKYRVHEGDNLLTGDLPVENYGQSVLGAQTNKKYLCVFNPNTNASFGIYKIGTGSQYAHLKQLEVNGSAGTEFGGGFTYVDFNTFFVASVVDPIPDRSNFQKTMICYIMVGANPNEIDAEATRLKTLTNN